MEKSFQLPSYSIFSWPASTKVTHIQSRLGACSRLICFETVWGRSDVATQQCGRGRGVGSVPSSIASISSGCSGRAAPPTGRQLFFGGREEKSEDGCLGRDPRWDQTDCGFCQRFPHSRPPALASVSVPFRAQFFFHCPPRRDPVASHRSINC